jgi:hypothetical protein
MVYMSLVLEQLLGHCFEKGTGHVTDVHLLVHHGLLYYKRTLLL